MNLTAIQTEVQARGFDYASTTRLNYWINRAYHRICEADDWTWLRTTTTGSAPLTISDLRTVLSVVDTTTQSVLTGLDERTIIDQVDPILTTTGTPAYFYRTSDTQLSVYPANTSDTLKVTYIKVPTDLSAGADTPVVPTRYHYAIIDGAVVEALKDSDNIAEAGPIEAAFQDAIREMQITYAFNHHGPDYQVAAPQDY